MVEYGVWNEHFCTGLWYPYTGCIFHTANLSVAQAQRINVIRQMYQSNNKEDLDKVDWIKVCAIGEDGWPIGIDDNG